MSETTDPTELGGVDLAVLSPASIAQVLVTEGKTCTLRVLLNGEEGRLYLRAGQLVDAVIGKLRGTPAAYGMLLGPSMTLGVEADVAPRPRLVTQSLATILLNGARLLDERPATGIAAGSATKTPVGEGSPEWAQLEAQVLPGRALEAQLNELRDEVPDFISMDIVNIDSGLSIAGCSLSAEFDESAAAASYAEVIKANRRSLELLGLATDLTEDILITTESFAIVLRLLGQDYYLGLTMRRRGNLGLARALMRRQHARLLRTMGDIL